MNISLLRSMVIALLTCFLSTAPLHAQTSSAPATTQWNSTDTQNRPVSVPAEKTSLLVFLRPDQPQSARLIELLQTIVKNRNDLQVIGIVSGDDAAQALARLPGTKWPYPLVTDPEYAASGKFAVRVWPTAILVRKNGEITAHIPGLPVSFQNDLEAYLDFAAGKIDKAALEKRLTSVEAVADSADQKASRHIEVAQRLAAQSMKEAAAGELAKALEFKPTDPLLLLSIARTQLMLGDAKAADSLLATLKDPALPSGEISFLKGWAALQLGRWDDAKAILSTSIKLNPDPAESFYLLGLIAQHENNTAQAADYFRKAFEHTTKGRQILP